jgi:hypothetical protein
MRGANPVFSLLIGLLVLLIIVLALALVHF